MNVVARCTLIDFWGKYPKTKALLLHWLNVTKAADWKSTQSVVGTFSKAKGQNSEQVRFEVAGGDYCMIVAFDFRRQVAFIKFIGTCDSTPRFTPKKSSLSWKSNMRIRPIRTDEDHTAALKEIERVWGANPGTPEADALDVLTTLVGVYENTRWPIKTPDPVDTLKAHMEATGRNQSDLAKVLGSRPRASEVIARKRRLTMNMVRKIASDWQLSAVVLIAAYSLKKTSARKARKSRRQRASSKKLMTA